MVIDGEEEAAAGKGDMLISSVGSKWKEKKKKKKKKKGGGCNRKMTVEQGLAFKAVREWVYLDDQPPMPLSSSSSSSSASFLVDDFGVHNKCGVGRGELVFELHSHTKCSDGFLSPSKLVERAHFNGVKVLALTDHDTMAGIPEALEAARRFGVKIIPGIEISTIIPKSDTVPEEPVHILAYYSSCGPTRFEQVEKFLGNIRDGRYVRAKNMVLKLNKLKLPLKWEAVTSIAGKGVAPGRLHVARAMLEAGHVESLKEAFSKYLHDGGPAYSRGNEPEAEEAVQLICKTGGVAVLAHPWALRNAAAIIKRLKDAGLHGMEVYRSDGKLEVYNELADAYGLLKLGGSDYHGRGGHGESQLGSVKLPTLVLHDFLKVGKRIWCSAMRDIVERYGEDPLDSNLSHLIITKARRLEDLVDGCLRSWLTNEEFEAIKLNLFGAPCPSSKKLVWDGSE